MTISRPLFAALAMAGVCAAGCGSGSTPTAQPRATPTPAALTEPASASLQTVACPGSALPGRYVVDSSHSGALTAHNYSQSADVQAALDYDKLESGSRKVYLDRTGAKVNRIASCVAMQFASAHLANRFFLSYQDTRDHAPSIVHKIRGLHGVPGVSGMTAYFEREQSFRGYHISSTNVIEIAGRSGDDLYIASVAAASPSAGLARTLLQRMVKSS